MAASMVIGAAFDQLLEVARETAKFQSMLKRLEYILTSLQPGFKKIQELHHVLGSPKQDSDLFLDVLEDGKRIVIGASKVRWWDLYSKYRYSRKLQNLEKKIIMFFQFIVATQNAIYSLEILVNQKNESPGNKSSSSSAMFSSSSSNPSSSPVTSDRSYSDLCFDWDLYQQIQDLKDFCKD